MASDSGIRYSIVVPFYNEQENIPPLYMKLTEVMDSLGEPYELVFVDDGSRDNTFKVLSDIYEHDRRVNLVRLRRNFGQTAALKAGLATDGSDLPALADDSGLVVPALGGAPGIYSARWAGPTKDFGAAMARVERLLQERGATTPEARRAHFVSALCVAWPDGHLEEVEARADGALVWPPRGTAGFGYDPMFLPDGHARTFGEMTSVEKHGLPPRGKGLSHRARAFVKLAEICLD